MTFTLRSQLQPIKHSSYTELMLESSGPSTNITANLFTTTQQQSVSRPTVTDSIITSESIAITISKLCLRRLTVSSQTSSAVDKDTNRTRICLEFNRARTYNRSSNFRKTIRIEPVSGEFDFDVDNLGYKPNRPILISSPCTCTTQSHT